MIPIDLAFQTLHRRLESAVADAAQWRERALSAEQELAAFGWVFGEPELRVVKWIDSSLQNVQVDRADFPKPTLITSVGFVVEETPEYVVLARDDMNHDGEFRGLCAIPKLAITPSVVPLEAVSPTRRTES